MPLNSKGCKAKINKVFSCNPNYQLVEIYTWRKNSPTSEKEYSVDWKALVYLRNNRVQVKVGDLIHINHFTVQSSWSVTKGNTTYYNIWDWNLQDAYDYTNLHIEYIGADDDENEE